MSLQGSERLTHLLGLAEGFESLLDLMHTEASTQTFLGRVLHPACLLSTQSLSPILLLPNICSILAGFRVLDLTGIGEGMKRRQANRHGHTEKLGLDGLGSLVGKLQHHGSSACLLYRVG